MRSLLIKLKSPTNIRIELHLAPYIEKHLYRNHLSFFSSFFLRDRAIQLFGLHSSSPQFSVFDVRGSSMSSSKLTSSLMTLLLILKKSNIGTAASVSINIVAIDPSCSLDREFSHVHD